MAHLLSVNVSYLGPQRQQAIKWAQAADEAGVHAFWSPETYGRDAFSILTELALNTRHALLGTGIVNVHSRTPGALAQHFATLHELSEGRAIAGLGTSGPRVVEGFHGVPFEPARTRLRECVHVMRSYLSGSETSFSGDVFTVAGFALRMSLPPIPLPILLGTLHPTSIRMTAEIADGWLPIWIPIDQLRDEVDRMKGWIDEVGRSAADFTFRAPGDVVVVNDKRALQQARRERAGRLAFFVARNGDFYYRQFVRHGLTDEAAAIRAAWDSGGRAAATQLVSDELLDQFDFVGTTEECLQRIEQQAAAGITLHQVMVDEKDPLTAAKILGELTGA